MPRNCSHSPSLADFCILLSSSGSFCGSSHMGSLRTSPVVPGPWTEHPFQVFLRMTSQPLLLLPMSVCSVGTTPTVLLWQSPGVRLDLRQVLLSSCHRHLTLSCLCQVRGCVPSSLWGTWRILLMGMTWNSANVGFSWLLSPTYQDCLRRNRKWSICPFQWRC